MDEHDTLRRFLFENAAIRGELVKLDATWREVLGRHEYPDPIRKVLGETMAAAALLSATIKYKGSLILQAQGKAGPVNLMVVECTSERTLRGMAHWSDDVPNGTLEEMFGGGYLAITIDPKGDMKRYQGIVDLAGESVAGALARYLSDSEQLGTQLWLAANEERAAGMLLQRMPSDQEVIDEDAWDRVLHLGSTLEREELLNLPDREILRRLFHEEDVRFFETEPVSFRCTCSRERVRNVLRGLGREEVDDIISEQGKVTVHCEFCNYEYSFDPVDVEELFSTQTPPSVPKTTH